nr:MAG TPA: hypothetical protein [Caudoviricetes sp.]
MISMISQSRWKQLAHSREVRECTDIMTIRMRQIFILVYNSTKLMR